MTHYPAPSRIYNIKADSLETLKHTTSKKHSDRTANASSEQTNMNPLSGLLAQYDSDSEHEELPGPNPNKLDSKVDDFLQEINNIASTEPGPLVSKNQNKNACAWQECFDETTGYPYYWNVQTNSVTWDMPEEYKKWLKHSPSIEVKPPDKIIPTEIKEVMLVKADFPKEKKDQVQKSKFRKEVVRNVRKKSIDSDDEKIVMITSFSEESSSESENESKEKVKTEDCSAKPETPLIMGPHIEDIPKELEVPNKKEIIENIKDENIDETVILARLRTQAKVLHELGGELPKSIDKSVLNDLLDTPKPPALALVAGYGDDSEPEEDPPTLFPIPAPENGEEIIEQSQSTLFPVSKPIDVKQFELPTSKIQNYVPEEVETETVVDNKVFKRKKRLGITFDVVKPEKKLKVESEVKSDLSEERKGLGFQLEENSNDAEAKTEKIAFVKSGISFVKADTLNPVKNKEKRVPISESEDKLNDFADIKEVVSEKVKFLGEGKDPVSAVQVMAIQLQTLELAFKAGGLTENYLYSWLRETFVDLKKLEQEAAPEGWQCQWDRSNKRYFYRNVSSGEWQWDFPVDIVGGGEAMDICTTPPPNEADEQHPANDKRCATPPTPPPPPIISKETTTTNKQTDNIQPPIPSAPPPVEVAPPPPPMLAANQPLPPGVDSPDLPFFASKIKETEPTVNDTNNRNSLGSELDSFYSDIAMIEATTAPSSSADAIKTDVENVPSPASSMENANVDKKKKKLKSKLGQGTNMKKKAVSTLVEKWKKVQNDY